MDEGYFSIDITSDMVGSALDRFKKSGGEFKNSYHKDKGKVWGYLGEEVVLACLGKDAKLVDERDFDILFKNFRIDVKTKTRKDAPRPDFDGMILASSAHQKVDYYFFVSILAPRGLKDNNLEEILKTKFEKAYVVGWISKEGFFKKSKLNRVGEVANNGVVWKEDAYTIPYSELQPYWPSNRSRRA